MFNLLNFWYSETIHRQHKFMISIGMCVMILILSKIAEMPKWAVICSLGLGIALHLLREVHQRFLQHKPTFLSNFLALLPFLGLAFLSFTLPSENRLIYIGQMLGFGFLGFVLASTLQYRAKRH